MALEVRYVPMKDEGDDNLPKIMRVIYKDGTAISYSPAKFDEARTADPTCVEVYFDLLSDYFKEVAAFCDAQYDFTTEMSKKMFSVMLFCNSYVSDAPSMIDNNEVGLE